MINQSLKNKRIIISAGASGIGLATTKVCLARGAYVYLCDINSKSLSKLNKHPLKNKKLFFERPFCPDSFVFCGASAMEINDLSDLSMVKLYQKKYFSLPKIYIYDNNIFIISKNVKKAKEIEDVLKFHLMILSHNSSDINFLTENELNYLSNWEAEKFRQKL